MPVCSLIGRYSAASVGDDVARAAIEELAGDHAASAIRLLDPKMLPPDLDSVAQQVHLLLAKAGPKPTISRVQWSYFRSLKKDWQKEEAVYHIVGPEAAALVFTTAETESGKTLLTRFYCEPSPRNLMDRYPFKLAGVSLIHYLFLVGMLATVGLILGAVTVCVRSAVRRKLLWLLLILVGFGKLTLYWMPGPFAWAMARVEPVSLSLLGVGMVKYPLYDPWALSLSIPVGAVIFLIRHRGRPVVERSVATEQPDAPDESR